MVTQDFSFPEVTNHPISELTVSPMLWRISSQDLPYYCHHEDEDRERNQIGEDDGSKSFSCVQSSILKREAYDDASEKSDEDRMDMLWEDLNMEELHSICHIKSEEIHSSSTGGSHDDDRVREEMVRPCCMQALKISKESGGLLFYPNKKAASMLVVLKVLKRFFLLHNSARLKKTPS